VHMYFRMGLLAHVCMYLRIAQLKMGELVQSERQEMLGR
jgi:hypothetical protein